MRDGGSFARSALALAIGAASTFGAGAARAFEVCVNGPSSYGGAIDMAAADAVIALQPRCVRLPYRQDVWASPDDATPRGPDKLGIFATYDALVQRYLAAGVEVYMLLHPESIGADSHVINTPPGRSEWVKGATKFVEHFKPTVRRFELINEPNNWDSTKQPTNPADAFAATLADAYSAVKVAHRGDRCWDVDLVSGALFAFHRSDGSGGAAADYLAATYAAGIAAHDWEGIKQSTGSYPLDGVGWHLYMEVTDAASTASIVSSYVGEVWNTVLRYEGAASPKSIWISELGFPTDGSAAQNASQATSLDNLFDALAAEPHVKMGVWFTIQDFDAAGWGLFTAGGFGAAHAKPSRARFAQKAASKVEGLWAKLAFESPPTTLAPGATAPIRIKATNLGSASWRAADKVRLASGPGCPETPSANALAWVPVSGFASSATDARVFLDPGDDVLPGGVKELAFAVKAPATPGTYRLSARMVKEGVEWFGTPAEVTVVVAAPGGTDASAPDAADAGDATRPPSRDAAPPSIAPSPAAPSDAGGCACRAADRARVGANSSAFAAAVALLALARASRRRRRWSTASPAQDR